MKWAVCALPRLITDPHPATIGTIEFVIIGPSNPEPSHEAARSVDGEEAWPSVEAHLAKSWVSATASFICSTFLTSSNPAHSARYNNFLSHNLWIQKLVDLTSMLSQSYSGVGTCAFKTLPLVFTLIPCGHARRSSLGIPSPLVFIVSIDLIQIKFFNKDSRGDHTRLNGASDARRDGIALNVLVLPSVCVCVCATPRLYTVHVQLIPHQCSCGETGDFTTNTAWVI